MKYYILINQLALHDTNLDLKDAAILDYLKDYCTATDNNVKELVFTEHGKNARYILVNFKKLIEDIPLLRIKNKSSISDRINKIAKSGFAITFRAPNGELYIRLTPKINNLNFVSRPNRKASVKTDGQAQGSDDTIYDPNTNPNNNIYNNLNSNTSPIPNSILINSNIKQSLHRDTDKQELHSIVKKFFSYYKANFMELISKKPPVFNWAQCERMAKPLIKSLGEDNLKALLIKYFKSDDQLYRSNAYSLSCFLSAKTIHKLNHLS